MSNDTHYKPHPLDVISHAHQMLDFVTDALLCDDFTLSTSGQNGLYFLLLHIASDLQDAEIRLTRAGAIKAGEPCRTDT